MCESHIIYKLNYEKGQDLDSNPAILLVFNFFKKNSMKIIWYFSTTKMQFLRGFNKITFNGFKHNVHKNIYTRNTWNLTFTDIKLSENEKEKLSARKMPRLLTLENNLCDRLAIFKCALNEILSRFETNVKTWINRKT